MSTSACYPRSGSRTRWWSSGLAHALAVSLGWACFAQDSAPAPGGDAVGLSVKMPRSLNGREVLPAAADGDYCVLLVGHAYGNHRHKKSIQPARNLLGNIDLINGTEPAFVSLLGDNVRTPREDRVAALRDSFAAAVPAPVFASPGEHDLMRGMDAYEQAFGPAYYRIELGSELFVMLDTGDSKSDTECDPAQLTFFEDALSHARASTHIENVIVLMHKVAWVRLPRYEGLRPLINNDRDGGFWASIYPALREAARTRQVFVGAGDIGHKSYGFILDVNPEDQITYFATGLADRPSDSIVQLQIPTEGPIAIRAVSLTDRPIQEEAATLDGFIRWGADG